MKIFFLPRYHSFLSFTPEHSHGHQLSDTQYKLVKLVNISNIHICSIWNTFYLIKFHHQVFLLHHLEIALKQLAKLVFIVFLWKKMEKFIISAAYLFFEKGNSCKMKVNFLWRIFEKFIVTKEATHPYILLIVLYSLDTKLCCYIYGIYY